MITDNSREPAREGSGEWVKVPREPTEAMMRPFAGGLTADTMRTLWAFFLSAAPPPPQVGGDNRSSLGIAPTIPPEDGSGRA